MGDGTTAAALRLALGRELTDGAVDWAALLGVAARERLVALAWLRSGALIREAAPSDIVDAWRSHAIAVDQKGRDRLGLLAITAMALDQAGIPTVVLKGMPLARRLYGDPFIRASDDIDLYVAPDCRDRAREALSASGWHHETGAAPWDELFSRGPRTRLYLEVHEMLLSDYLAHLPRVTPRTAPIDLGGVTVAALEDPIEPAYLAAHLAGHQRPPLLWLIDFATLWNGLDDDRRRAAEGAARSAGLHRYLDWAIAMTFLLDGCADGDPSSLAELGIAGADRQDDHMSVWRHARLAANPVDAARAIGACLWPRPLRGDWRATGSTSVWRLRRRLRRPTLTRRLRATPAAPPPAIERPGSS